MSVALPLRRKLNRLLLGIGLVAFVAAAGVVAWLSWSAQREQLVRLMRSRVDVVHGVIQRRLQDESARLDRFAEDLSEGSAERAHFMLDHLPKLHGGQELFYMLDAAGRVSFVPESYTHFLGLDFSHLPLLAQGRPVSKVHQSLFTRRSVISFLRRLPDGRTLVMEQGLDNFGPLVESFELGKMFPGALQFLLSGDGTVIYHPDPELVRSRHNLEMELHDRHGPNSLGIYRFRLRGQSYMSYGRKIGLQNDWTFYYSVPISLATETAMKNVAVHLAMLGLVSLLLFQSLAWLLNRYFSVPVTNIVDALDRFDLHAAKDVIALRDGRGILELERIIGAVNDMAVKTRSATEKLEAREQMFRTVTENDTNLAFWLTPEGFVRYITPSCQRITGYSQKEFYADPGLLDRMIDPQHRTRWRQHIHGRNTSNDVPPLDFCFVTRAGDTRWLRHFCKPIIGNRGELLGYRSSNIDVTEQKAAEQQLVRNAFYDGLTGLANRSLLKDRLSQAVARLKRDSFRFALLYLDLDRFKVINDSLGHSVGDDLLIAVGQELLSRSRPGDTVARLGGDEFAVLLENVGGEEDALGYAERIHERMRKPFQLGDYEVFSTLSIGLTRSDQGADADAADLLRDADTAMYRAKSQGRDCTQVFDQAMHRAAVERLGLENDLRRALDQGQLLCFYQPILSLPHGEVCGCEALVRWRHPERGMISPGQFIPIAEETGMILALGEQVLHQAVATLRDWQVRFPATMPLTMNVNLSGIQLSQSHLVDLVRELLLANAIQPGNLNLEITETVLMEYAGVARNTLDELKTLGVHLSMDDFGSGYSALNYLRKFPFNCLKIEKSFVQNMTRREDDRLIVRTIVDLAHNLGLEVVAEGVETLAQRSALEQLGCDYAQGFLFSRPLPQEEILDFLQVPRPVGTSQVV